MPRRAEIQPRTVDPDPVYGSVLVTQLVNRLMSDGKKSIAERVVYDALTQVADKTGKPALEALDAAVGRGMSSGEGFTTAWRAATCGRDDTIPMVARKGRASYLGERSAGHQDPGATSSALLFEAAARAFEG